MATDLFRSIPSVDRLLQHLEQDASLTGIPRTLIKELVNAYLEEIRNAIRRGSVENEHELEPRALLPDLTLYIRKRSRPRFRRVLNATGVVVHTNLGRSLLAQEAVEAMKTACTGYSNLEFDLETGQRGSRYDLVQDLLCELSGAEAALVVNNNAAAVLLVLNTLAQGGEVIVSRGELVEIGGSFRIPEVMERSGAVLREVGATNRTHPADYERAIGPETAALLKAHTSNYRIVGFHKEVDASELAAIAKDRDLPVIEDLGSGNLLRFPGALGQEEPTVQDTVAKGVSVICFSGDKLLGGPQAGIILGKERYIRRIQANPLNRALRIDKMTLAALESTLRLYKDPEAAQEKIPTLEMICASESSLRNRAAGLARKIRKTLGKKFRVETAKGTSRVGGGASPTLALPTHLVRLIPRGDAPDLETLRRRLLDTNPPLVGRVEDDALCLDPRTLRRLEAKDLVAALQQAVHNGGNHT
ncbi:MAG: L-seryl-tRNA(Sec) selenium transferase [Desulfohalobiaceae bacterium]|nr:L-seryl-tRNA(Sec) selenium transferase [Desulfohalobiaceae bacterium]